MTVTLKSFASLTCLGALILLGVAWGAEIFLSLKPCLLCLYARYAYVALAFTALVTLFCPQKAWPFLLLVALIGIALSFYHFGVEQHWWRFDKCALDLSHMESLKDLKEHMMQGASPRCDEVVWAPLGLSATFWNILIFSGVALGVLKFKK